MSMEDNVLDRKNRIKHLVEAYCTCHNLDKEIQETLLSLIYMMMEVYGYNTKIPMPPDTTMFTKWLIKPIAQRYGYNVEDVILNKLFFNIQGIKMAAPQNTLTKKKIAYDPKTRVVYIDKEEAINLLKEVIGSSDFSIANKEMPKGELDIKRRVYFAPILLALQTNFNYGSSSANKQYFDLIQALEADSKRKDHANKYYYSFNFLRPKFNLEESPSLDGTMSCITYNSDYAEWLKEGELNHLLNPQIQNCFNVNNCFAVNIFNKRAANVHSAAYGVMLMCALGPKRVFQRLYFGDNSSTDDLVKYFYNNGNLSFEHLLANIYIILEKANKIYESGDYGHINQLINMELELMSALINLYEMKLGFDQEYPFAPTDDVIKRVKKETDLMCRFHPQARINGNGIIDFNIIKTIHQNLSQLNDIMQRYTITRQL